MLITGKNIDLREITPDDAEFVLSLRLDPELGQYLSSTDSDPDKQRQWIENYVITNKFQNSNQRAWYFIIQNKQGLPVGTIRIYDIRDNSFCWGSWIVQKNARKYASLESVILLYDYAFLTLGFKQTHFDARKQNQKAIAFYTRFGASITHKDQENFYFLLTKETYLNHRDEYLVVIENIQDRNQTS